MRLQRYSIYVPLLLACIGGAFLAHSWFYRPVAPRVHYASHHGDNPTLVQMTFSAPTTDLAAIPETPIKRALVTDELLSIKGTLAIKDNRELVPIIAKFVEHREKGDVIGNSAVFIPTSKDVEMLINVPKQPGKYSLLLEWGGANTYISHCEVIVQ